MKRRQFITLLGGAAVWPLATRAQQQATPPVIGFLNGASADSYAGRVRAFRDGLREAGFVEGRNVAIEFRWADGQYERLPGLAADLVGRQVTVIVAGSNAAAVVAKRATTTVPVVFSVATDPVEIGLVASLNRPGGNLTGVTNLNTELGPKRLELMHELVPKASVIAVLVNPLNRNAEALLKDLHASARAIGVRIEVLRATSEHELDAVFTRLAEAGAGGLVIGADAFFNSRNEQLAALSFRHKVPSIFQFHDFAAAGGLMSYGGSFSESYRMVGLYTGRILKGEKPAELPVQQSTKAELIVNLKTAKALGLEVPGALLARADEVIE